MDLITPGPVSGMSLWRSEEHLLDLSSLVDLTVAVQTRYLDPPTDGTVFVRFRWIQKIFSQMVCRKRKIMECLIRIAINKKPINLVIPPNLCIIAAAWSENLQAILRLIDLISITFHPLYPNKINRLFLIIWFCCGHKNTLNGNNQ